METTGAALLCSTGHASMGMPRATASTPFKSLNSQWFQLVAEFDLPGEASEIQWDPPNARGISLVAGLRCVESGCRILKSAGMSVRQWLMVSLRDWQNAG